MQGPVVLAVARDLLADGLLQVIGVDEVAELSASAAGLLKPNEEIMAAAIVEVCQAAQQM